MRSQKGSIPYKWKIHIIKYDFPEKYLVYDISKDFDNLHYPNISIYFIGIRISKSKIKFD